MTDDGPTDARPDSATGPTTSERNAAARARGLAAPYIPGGRDPDPEAGLQEERRYLRLLADHGRRDRRSRASSSGILVNAISVMTAG